MIQFSELNIRPSADGMVGDKIKVERVMNREISVHSYRIENSKFDRGNGKCLYLQIAIGEEKHVVFSGSGVLMDMIQQVPKDKFPFVTKIVKQNERFEFT